MNLKAKVSLNVLAALGLGMLTGMPAGATVLTDLSSAEGASSTVTFTPANGGQGTDYSVVGTPALFDTAPAPFNLTTSGATASVAGTATTSGATLNVTSTVDGVTPGSQQSTASSVVSNLSITLSGLLTLSATTLSSTSVALGDYGALGGGGTTSISAFSIGGSGALDITPTANDIVFNSNGVVVELNAQASTGDSISTAQYFTDSLVIYFTQAAFSNNGTAGYLNGTLTVGATEVSETAGPAAVPEPASLALFGAGVFGVGLFRRSRTRRSA